MTAKRSAIFTVLGLLAIAAVILCIYSSRPPVAPLSTWAALQAVSRSRIATAVQAFGRDRKLHDVDPTNSVSLRELLSGGYVQASDVRGLEGKDVRVSLAPERATALMVWISVREPDGSELGVLGDGSMALAPKP
jgi:hypothetical protein